MAKAEYLLCENFLSPEQARFVLQYSVDHEFQFRGSTVVVRGEDAGSRRSRVLTDLNGLRKVLGKPFDFPRICNSLGVAPFTPSRIEAEITASNDGDFFQAHIDSGLVFLRAISFVFYFFTEPKGFSGGALRLYDIPDDGDDRSHAAGFTEIEPRNNTAIFFRSERWHEVMPVHCADKAFRHSRFTLNGWISR